MLVFVFVFVLVLDLVFAQQQRSVFGCIAALWQPRALIQQCITAPPSFTVLPCEMSSHTYFSTFGFCTSKLYFALAIAWTRN